jgi:hypothetical protein
VDLVPTNPGDWAPRTLTMAQAQSYRITCQVPLLDLVTFCRSLQRTLATAYSPAEFERIWRLYVSAECPACGIQVCGDELRALALRPCAELASAKIGRMRLGDCARLGCGTWHYSVHFWNQENIDWPSLLEAAEELVQERTSPSHAPLRSGLRGLVSLATRVVPRSTALLGVLVLLWLARELYLGGRIPFLHEPEKFIIDTSPPNRSWPAPMDGSEGPMH